MHIDTSVRPARLIDVPEQFIRYTCGNIGLEKFNLSGMEVYTMLNLSAHRYGGKPLSSFDNILDFACGAGRVLQYIPDGPRLFASDVNQPLIDYVTEKFPQAHVSRNEFMPPLAYGSNTFDLIYSFSLFSHLDENDEKLWLAELSRIGRQDCLYLVTVHGDWAIENHFSGEDLALMEQKGFAFRRTHSRRGHELDFPEGYELSYHTSDYIKREWADHFDIVDVIKGDKPYRHLWGELAFQPNGTVPPFRPMGQDLVVMRKR